MTKYALVFPGQGAQVVGMGQDISELHPEAAAIFKRADEALGFSLSNIIWNGPEEELRLTYYTQPAILTASIALHEVFKKQGITPICTAGHSLGEYTALVAAGAMEFEDAVRLVHARGKFMDEAVPAGIGAMSAVMGLDRETIGSICRDVSGSVGPVEMANINSPGQVVISGQAEAVARAGERIAEQRGKVKALVVSGPFHSSLMQPAADKLALLLEETEIRDAKIPVIANVSAKPVRKADEIRRALVQQMAHSVLWEDSVQTMIQDLGVDRFLEIGPGKVLAGLIKKIDKTKPTLNISNAETYEATLSAWKEE